MNWWDIMAQIDDGDLVYKVIDKIFGGIKRPDAQKRTEA